MHLVYLRANMAYVFVFGHDIETATIQTMGRSNQRFFDVRRDAVRAAAECGLLVDDAGNVSVLPDEVNDAVNIEAERQYARAAERMS